MPPARDLFGLCGTVKSWLRTSERHILWLIRACGVAMSLLMRGKFSLNNNSRYYTSGFSLRRLLLSPEHMKFIDQLAYQELSSEFRSDRDTNGDQSSFETSYLVIIENPVGKDLG